MVVAVGAGIVTFVAWYVLARADVLTALTFAISAVVIACPDALGLATPTAVAVATGLGAKLNILFKDAATLEMVARIRAIILDKTGTLTEGRPELTDVVPVGDHANGAADRDELLRLVASAESGSEHPLATAIVRAANERKLAMATAEGFAAITGKGMVARVDGHEVLVGNAALLAERAIRLNGLESAATSLASDGKTPMLVAIDGRPAGIIAVADAIKPSAHRLITELKRSGIEVAMITGDNRRTADAVARNLGIERVFAEVLPPEKAEHVRRLQD